jgi:beta-glucosidase
LKLSKTELASDETMTVTLDVTNNGNRAGAEVVQLYVQDVQASVPRPAKELKGFKRIALTPGQKGLVTFKITKPDLSFYDEAKRAWIAEDGEFKVLVGSSSRDIKLKGTFTYKI